MRVRFDPTGGRCGPRCRGTAGAGRPSGKVADDRLEAREDGIERGAQAIDREVAREHAALDAEDPDRIAHDRAVGFDRPRLARLAEARDLDRGIRAGGERRHRGAPAGQAFRAAVGGQAGVVEDDPGLRKVARQRSRLLEVPPGRLQVERQPILCEQGEAALPGGVAHRPRRVFLHSIRRGGRSRLVADAADAWERDMAREHRFDLGIVEAPAGDDAVREAFRGDHLGEPAALADRVARVPLGLDEDRLDDVMPGSVAEVVGRHVVAPERAVVAIAERDRLGIAQPRQIVAREIPEVLVRIDDRQVGHLKSPGLRCSRTPAGAQPQRRRSTRVASIVSEACRPGSSW